MNFPPLHFGTVWKVTLPDVTPEFVIDKLINDPRSSEILALNGYIRGLEQSQGKIGSSGTIKVDPQWALKNCGETLTKISLSLGFNSLVNGNFYRITSPEADPLLLKIFEKKWLYDLAAKFKRFLETGHSDELSFDELHLPTVLKDSEAVVDEFLREKKPKIRNITYDFTGSN